jgi:integrase
MRGWIEARETRHGKRYDAIFRTDGCKRRAKTFDTREKADAYLVRMVGEVHDGTYVDVRPVLMGDVFDRWLTHSLEIRLLEGSLKRSTARGYRSMIEQHLRPAFGRYRSDRFTLGVVEEWRAGLAQQIAQGAVARKTYSNLKTLLHVIVDWARHRERRYLASDPLSGLPRIALPRTKRRPHFEPDQVATILAAATPPDDTIIKVAVFSGLRRGELFGVKWSDIDADSQCGGRLHVRRTVNQGVIDTPKTEDSDRVVDIPQEVLDELEIYRLTHPPIGDGYIFRTRTGRPMDGDTWHHRRLVPLLKRLGLYKKGLGLHSLGRHTYVSLLIAQGEDVGYIADQVGHSTTRLTQDLYRHVFNKTRQDAMRKLGAAIPRGIGHHRAETDATGGPGRNSVERER